MDKTDYIMGIIRGNWFYLRRIEELENKSEQELILYVEKAIKDVTKLATILDNSIKLENLPKTNCFNPDDFKGTEIRMGVIVRKGKASLDEKIAKALGWMPNLNYITSKGRTIIGEYRNL